MSLRGKRAEKKLTKFLKELSKDVNWWVHRLPDAAVCKGRLQKQPADYMVMYKGAPLLIEVKEEKRPDKLAKSRLTQLPKMRLFEMAGGAAVFLIYHYEQDVWRVFSPLYVTNNTPSTMDLTEFSTINNLEDVFGIMENHLRR